MRTTIIFIGLWFGICNAGATQNDILDSFGWSPQAGITAPSNYVSAPAVPVRCILPDEIIQDSIQLLQFTTNDFMVKWTYTEAGARKMLAFDEAHMGKTVRIEVGSYEFTGRIAPFTSLPGCASYAEWRAGWLKHRTDKFFCVNEEDAKEILAGLKN